MSKQHRDIITRLSELRDDMNRIAAKDNLSATDEKHFHELDSEFKQLDIKRMKLEREMDVEKIKELAKDPRNIVPGFEAGGAENDVRGLQANRNHGSDQDHRAGQWLASEPAIREASQRLRAQWGLTRALVGSGTTGGGALTPSDQVGFVFDFLAAQSVFLRSGVATMETDRDSVIIPHALTDAASAWVAEAATITPTDPTSEQITATPRKLAALTAISNEAIADANPSVLDWVGRGLLRSLALKYDLGAYEGSGTSPEVRGLKNVTGISTVSMGANGAIPTTLDHVADAIGTLEADNAEANAIVMHPRSWKTLLKLKETSTANKALLQDEQGGAPSAPRRSLYGVPVFLTSQLSITETQGTSGAVASSAYVYDRSQVVAVMRQDARVELDSSRLFNSDQSELRCTMRADVVVPNPKAVVRILGILA